MADVDQVLLLRISKLELFAANVGNALVRAMLAQAEIATLIAKHPDVLGDESARAVEISEDLLREIGGIQSAIEPVIEKAGTTIAGMAETPQ